jgi:hypothetical protein
LTAQTRVFRDGKAVFSGNATPVNVIPQADLKRVPSIGRMQLGTEFSPGNMSSRLSLLTLWPNKSNRSLTVDRFRNRELVDNQFSWHRLQSVLLGDHRLSLCHLFLLPKKAITQAFAAVTAFSVQRSSPVLNLLRG